MTRGENATDIKSLRTIMIIRLKSSLQLELALEAKEYLDKGHSKAQVWMDRIAEVLQTDSAKRLLREIQSIHSCDWWKNLKKKPQTEKKEYVSRV